MTRIFFLWTHILLIAITTASLTGCVTSSPDERWKPVVRHDGNQVHIVKWTDETLSAIASWYTGSSDNLDGIANANPTLDPLHLRQGDHVFIPQNLLKTRGDMSRIFLNTYLSSPVVTTKTSSGSVVSPEPRIIAPIPYKVKKVVHAEDPASSLTENQATAAPPPVSSPEEDVNLQLFGPK